MFHKNIVPADNHTILSWTVADPAALAALSPTADDVGKVAHQLSPPDYFILYSHSPVEWKSLTGAKADQIPVVDSDGYYTATNVEDILSEIGASINSIEGQLNQVLGVACSDETTNLTVGTNKVAFHMPHKFQLQEVFAGLTVAQASGSSLVVDVHQNGTTIFSSKPTFDNTELTTLTAATPAALSVTTLNKGDLITVDIDIIGTLGAKGLKVYFIGRTIP